MEIKNPGLVYEEYKFAIYFYIEETISIMLNSFIL